MDRSLYLIYFSVLHYLSRLPKGKEEIEFELVNEVKASALKRLVCKLLSAVNLFLVIFDASLELQMDF